MAPSVTAEPSSVLLGTDDAVEITVRGGGDLLRAYAAIGALVPYGAQFGETRTWRWVPPDIRYPTTAVLLFWTQAESAKDITVLRIPLVGRTDLKISTEPKARVRVQVQERLFGPVKADGRGRASVPIEVPPGVRRARVLVEAGGTKSTREAPIDVPAVNPLAAVFATESFAADERGTLIVANVANKDARITTTGGAASATSSADDVTLYSVQAERGRSSVSVTAQFRDFRADAASPVRPAGTKLPSPQTASAWTPFVGAGGFFAGGSNLGPAVAAGVGRQFGVLRLALEVEAGFRAAAMSADVPGLGAIDSRVLAFPITVGARYGLLRYGMLRLDARAGAGVVLFSHTLEALYQPTLSEFGVRPSLFAALSGGVRLGMLEPFVELRAEWNQIRTPALWIRPGGALVLVGSRFSWR